MDVVQPLAQDILGCWLLFWSAVALNAVNSVPYLMTVASDGERNHAFSAQAALMSFMGFVGSVVAGLLPGPVASWLGTSLAQPAPYWYILWLVPVTYLVISLVWTQSPPVYLEAPRTHGKASTRMPLALFCFFGLVTFLFAAGDGAVRAFFNVYLDADLQVSTSQIGMIMGAGQLIPVAVALVVPALVARWGTAGTLLFGALGAAVALLTLSGWPFLPAAAMGFIGVQSTSAVSGPARNIFGQETVAPHWRATMSAISTIGLALGWAAAVAAGGYLVSSIGFQGIFAVTAILSLLSALLLLAYLRQRRRASTISLAEKAAAP